MTYATRRQRGLWALISPRLRLDASWPHTSEYDLSLRQRECGNSKRAAAALDMFNSEGGAAGTNGNDKLNFTIPA